MCNKDLRKHIEYPLSSASTRHRRKYTKEIRKTIKCQHVDLHLKLQRNKEGQEHKGTVHSSTVSRSFSIERIC